MIMTTSVGSVVFLVGYSNVLFHFLREKKIDDHDNFCGKCCLLSWIFECFVSFFKRKMANNVSICMDSYLS